MDTIDLDRLRKPEPILFFDEIVLFEDELADNGTAMYTVKLVSKLSFLPFFPSVLVTIAVPFSFPPPPPQNLNSFE